MREVHRTVLQMGTIVHFSVVQQAPEKEMQDLIARAQAAFVRVEAACSRFDPDSELRQLCTQVNTPVPVSDILFQTLRFSLVMAEETDGLFDPTVGRLLHAKGFRQHYLTRAEVKDAPVGANPATFRDVVLDEENQTVTILRPLTLDLGAVAKGFAVDLAASVLQPYGNFMIDAGGDVYVGGHNVEGTPWRVGIRHPLQKDDVMMRFLVTDVAVCTSGGYERHQPNQPGEHHLISPFTGESPNQVISTTVLAPYAMLADACSTSAFLLSNQSIADSILFLDELGVEGLLIDSSMTVHKTKGLEGKLDATIF